MVEHGQATPFAEIDPEWFTDFASVRPHVRLVDGSRRMMWPAVELWSASTPGADVILVLGPEPALRWRAFTEQLLGVGDRLGARTLLTLGALLGDVAHRDPVAVFGTSDDDATNARYELQPSNYEGPTGIVGVLGHTAAGAGLRTVSLWAAVPAYAGHVTSPVAAAALVRRTADIIGTPASALALDIEAEDYVEAVEALIAADDDLAHFVRQLEQRAFDDDDANDDGTDGDGGPVGEFSAPGHTLADEPVDPGALIDEVERFLRDRNQD
jgi:proteasome assembly chaperone (PAC2) family protein